MFRRRTDKGVLGQFKTRNGLSGADAFGLLIARAERKAGPRRRSPWRMMRLLTGPNHLSSVRSVVGHSILSVEPSFQLCRAERCFDLVAESLPPSCFPPFHSLLMNTLLSQLGTVFSFLLVSPVFLCSVLDPEYFSCLAKSPALLVFLAGTLASLPGVCGLGVE